MSYIRTPSSDLIYDSSTDQYIPVGELDTVYTQSDTPIVSNPVFDSDGTYYSAVHSYDSSRSIITIDADAPREYTRDYTKTLMWDRELNAYVGNCTLTIIPEPSDATVVLLADGYLQDGNKITVSTNTNVSIQVSKSGYYTYANSVVLTQNQILHVALEELPYSGGELVFENGTAGTYTFTPEATGNYTVVLVGGGGGGAADALSYSYKQSTSVTNRANASAVAGGGSGYVYTGTVHLDSSTTYTITVGAGGTGRSGGASTWGNDKFSGESGGSSSIGDVISVNGGTGGYVHATIDTFAADAGADSTGGSGYNSGKRDYHSGYGRTLSDLGGDISLSAAGGAGYNGKGAGGAASKWDTISVSASNGSAGYVKINFSSYD